MAHAVVADPLASKFSPESVHDLPVELSQWLHLFYAYLQVEQAYADALASLGRTGMPSSLASTSFADYHRAQQCFCDCRSSERHCMLNRYGGDAAARARSLAGTPLRGFPDVRTKPCSAVFDSS